MKLSRLNELTSRFSSLRIAVFGDFFLDKYLETDPSLKEKSVETGKTAHQVIRIRQSPGAAGTVVNNLASLGCRELHAIGFTGDDGEGYDLRQCLRQVGCSTRYLRCHKTLMTPTYLKPRDVNQVALSGELERYDIRNRKPLPPNFLFEILENLKSFLDQLDGVIIEDQVTDPDLGVVTSSLRSNLASMAKHHPKIVFWADSRANIRSFRQMIIKPNQFEVVDKIGSTLETSVELDLIRKTLPGLRSQVEAPVCVTLGESGILVTDPGPTLVPGVKVEGPLDITGAGDSVTAGAVLALASGASLPEAALVGNLVASVTIQQLATTGTATCKELTQQLTLWNKQNPTKWRLL